MSTRTSSRRKAGLESTTNLCLECQNFLGEVLALLPKRSGGMDDHWFLTLKHQLGFQYDAQGALIPTPKANCDFCNLIATGWRQTSWISGRECEHRDPLPGVELNVYVGPGGGGIDSEVEGKAEKEWRMVHNVWDLQVTFGDDLPNGKPTGQLSWSSAMKLNQLSGSDADELVCDHPEKPTSTIVTTTNSPSTYEYIEEALQRCKESHMRCKKFRSRDVGDEDWRPSRLLDLRGLDIDLKGSIRLVSGAAASSDQEYATLSYCWGSEHFTRLTKATRPMLEAGFSAEILPKTFREAVEAAKKFGIPYIWIDALCIVQDDPDDWSRESLSMSKVYTYAALNISANTSNNANGGLFRPHQAGVIDGFILSKNTVSIPATSHSSDLRIHCYLKSPNTSDVHNSPTSQRGWILQERTLSSRIVYFTNHQVFWECKTQRACQSHPDGYHSDDFDGSTAEPYALTLADCFVGERGHDYYVGGPTEVKQEDIFRLWNRLIRVYSKLSFSYDSDKLIALSGVASKLGSSCQLGDYLAGIWHHSLPLSLLWYATDGCTQPLEYRAPSWSWASLDGRVEFGFAHSKPGTHRPVLEVLDASVSYTGVVMGAISSASLQLRTQMCLVKFDEQTQGARYVDGVLHLNPEQGYQPGHSLLQLQLDPPLKPKDGNGKATTEEVFLLPVLDMLADPTSNPLNIKSHEAWYLLVSPTGAVDGRFRRIAVLHLIHYRFVHWPESKNPLMFLFESLGTIASLVELGGKTVAYFRKRLPYAEIRRALNDSRSTMDKRFFKDVDRQGRYCIELV